MELELLPLLQVQRDLLNTGRGFERFKQYLDLMTAGSGEIALPLATFNPMSKPHVAELLDALIAMGAEEVARAALDEAALELRDFPGELRVGLVIADDAMGGWTNRFLTDARHRFEDVGEIKRGFATPLIWTGEAATRELVRTETLTTIYRSAYRLRHGGPQTLRAMLTQEGLVGAFAGLTPTLARDDLARFGERLLPPLDTTPSPVAFACLYG